MDKGNYDDVMTPPVTITNKLLYVAVLKPGVKEVITLFALNQIRLVSD